MRLIYYVVRANALEDNVVLYKVEQGKRTDLKPEGAWFFENRNKVPVRSGVSGTLRVEVRGTRFAVSFSGEHMFELEDDTFSEPGRVGLWTKADSVTAFDDLSIKSYDAG